MKLPLPTLDLATQLVEFDVWITPSLGEVRETERFRDELSAVVQTCPSQSQGQVSDFFRGCWRPISAARSLTLWIVPNGPGLLLDKCSSPAGIAFLSGPIRDRVNRVTQACHLERMVSKHDR